MSLSLQMYFYTRGSGQLSDSVRGRPELGWGALQRGLPAGLCLQATPTLVSCHQIPLGLPRGSEPCLWWYCLWPCMASWPVGLLCVSGTFLLGQSRWGFAVCPNLAQKSQCRAAFFGCPAHASGGREGAAGECLGGCRKNGRWDPFPRCQGLSARPGGPRGESLLACPQECPSGG